MPNSSPSDDRIARSAEYWDEHNLERNQDVVYWLGVQVVREWVNLSMTGDANQLFTAHFLESLKERWPIARALSVGCGTGDLEHGGVELGAVAEIDGIEVSDRSLGEAQRALPEPLLDRNSAVRSS